MIETVAVVQVVTLLVGGSMALNGQVNPEQLTTFVLYVEFVTAASLSVCDQWGPLMEAIGASERVMYYLDRPPAPQIGAGRKLPSWSGKVHPDSHLGSSTATSLYDLMVFWTTSTFTFLSLSALSVLAAAVASVSCNIVE